MKPETTWIIEPNYNRAPSAGYFAARAGKNMPENAIKIWHEPDKCTTDKDRWRMYVNGRIIHKCGTWKELAMKYPQGIAGRPLTGDEYDRLVHHRINDERNGGIVALDPMTHPAPRF